MTNKVKPFFIRITDDMTPQMVQDAFDKCVDVGVSANDCIENATMKNCGWRYSGYIHDWKVFGVIESKGTWLGDDPRLMYSNAQEITLDQLDEWLGLEVEEEWKNSTNRTVYGVGCLDEGPYLAFTNGEPTKAYYTWANMLKRCYCEASLKARPTYKGCSVCDEWHSFQNFAAWFYENYIDGYHLDKDVIIDGNKTYSPELCSFISHADNNIKARAKEYTFYHNDFGLVKIYNLNAFCKERGLNSGHMCSVNSGSRKSHNGWTKPEAPEQKAERERLEAIKEMAQTPKPCGFSIYDICEQLYDAGYRKK